MMKIENIVVDQKGKVIFTVGFAVAFLLWVSLAVTVAANPPHQGPDGVQGGSFIGDYVWYDANVDGDHQTLDEAEYAGINGVKMNLYHDANGNGQIDAGEYMASTFTGDNPATTEVETGWYQFEVPPDDTYLIEVDGSNFVAGGPLEHRVLTSGDTYGVSPIQVTIVGLAGVDNLADFGFVTAQIALQKTPSVTVATIGDDIVYTYAVTNPGDAPLSNVTLVDDKCSPVSGPAAGSDANGNNLLDPGELWLYTCHYMVQASDADPLVNAATVTAQPARTDGPSLVGADPVQATDTASVLLRTPVIHLAKSADPIVSQVGDTVTYTYQVANPGDTPLVNVQLDDDKCISPAYQSGDDGDGILQVGEVWTYTCTYLVQETDPNPLVNTATVTAQPSDDTGNPFANMAPVSDEDAATVMLVSPAIAITKLADPSVILPGDSVQYAYRVSNPGTTPLATVSVTDDHCAPVNGPASGDSNQNALLDPGEIWLYACTTTLTTDTVNTATATGQPSDAQGAPLPGFAPVQATATATVNVINPHITLNKIAAPLTVHKEELVTYVYAVSNNGDTPLANIALVDDKCPSVSFDSGDDNGDGILQTGETWLYRCLISLSQDTTNTAIVTGRPSDANGMPFPGIAPVQATDTAVVDVIHPAIHIEKTASASQVQPGDTVLYSYLVTNSGDTPLYNVSVVDDKCSSPVYQSGDDGDSLLQPGETWTYTCAMTLVEDTTNTATATGVDVLGRAVHDADTVFVDVLQPGLTITKEADVAVVHSGDVVHYTMTVRNTGNDPAYNVVVADNRCGPLSGPSGDNGDGVLQTTETWVYTCSATVRDDTVNVAVVIGSSDPLGITLITPDSADARVDVIHPDISVQKQVDKTTISAGDTVHYTYEVSNPGDDPLTSINVADDQCANLVYQSGDNGDGVLQPGEAWIYTCTTTLNADTTNTVTASGIDSLGAPVNDTDTATVDVVTPGIGLQKSVNHAVALSNAPVHYTYLVSNLGDVALSAIDISDDSCAPLVYQSGDSNANGVLDIDEVWRYGCTATLVDDTLNTATVTGLPSDDLGTPLPGFSPVQASDTAFVDVIHPAIAVTKTVSSLLVYGGDSVTYHYGVSNPGDVALSSVVLSDDTCASLVYQSGDNGDGLLQTNETWLYTCTMALSHDTTNTVTAIGRPSDASGTPYSGIASVQATDTATVDVINPAVHIAKTASSLQVQPGDTVLYTYVVTNPGDAPLHNVAVTDDKCASPAYQSGDDGDGILLPGEAWTYTCSAVLNDDTTNTATVSALDALDGSVTDTDSIFVDVMRAGLDITKTASPSKIHSGDLVTFTLSVRNTGSDPAYNVVVSDDHCSPLSGPSGDNGDGVLQTFETWLYTCVANVSEDTINIATVTGASDAGGATPLAPDSDQAKVDVIHPAIAVHKQADKTTISAGDAVLYTYEVSNPGDDPLRNVSVSDDHCVSPAYQSGDDGDGVLWPGEIWLYTCATALSADTTNTVTATGVDSLGSPVSATDTAFVDVVHPAIQLQKSADPAMILADEMVTYTFVVDNTGDTPLGGVTVDDDACAPVTYLDGDTDGDHLLDVNESWRFSCATAVNHDTHNVATVIGQPVDEQGVTLPEVDPVTATDAADVDVIDPAIGVAKRVASVVHHADDSYTVTYVLDIDNLGDVPLSNIQVTDDLSHAFAAAVGFSNVTLASTDFAVKNGIYTGAPPAIELLSGADTLPVGGSGSITLTVDVVPGSNLGPYINQVIITSTAPTGDVVIDRSDNGVTPDPNHNRNANELGENDPTPVAFDPSGYIYDETNGAIVPGGSIAVVGPGAIAITKNGSDGSYEFFTDGTAGVYTVTVTPPPGYGLSVTCSSQDPPPMDPTGGPDPTVLGQNDDGTGHLSSYACADNPYYFTFDLASGDPAIQLNNYPITGIMSLGDLLWLDSNNNGIYDIGSESGIAGVEIQLFASGADPLVDSPLQTTTTDTNGNYLFTGLTPGDYFVYIPASQFAAGGPLEGYTSSTGNDVGGQAPDPDDDVDNDDNGNPGSNGIVSGVITLTGNSEPTNDGDADNNSNRTLDLGVISAAQIGDFVWWDINGDGVQDAGEPGIQGVTLTLTDGITLHATTDANGHYDFSYLPTDTYTLTIDASNFSPGGALENWVATTGPITRSVTLASGEVNLDQDFGFDKAASYTLSKQLNTTGDIRPGDPVSFTVSITNTGDSWLGVLPLVDVYDTTYLSYGYNGVFSSPSSDDDTNDGQLNWSDLVSTLGQIAPGQTAQVTIWFTAVQETGAAPGGATVNTASTNGVMADPDGPNGPLGADESLGAQADSAAVIINQPTGLFVTAFSAELEGADVRLHWQTASELPIAGFQIVRRRWLSNEVSVVADFVPAQWPGMDQGGWYQQLDQGVAPGVYIYTINIHRLDGTLSHEASIRVVVRGQDDTPR